MCGIAGGVLTPHAPLDLDAAVQLMCDRMRPRGPDAGGSWTDPDHCCVLGARRLSIIDPIARSDQPLTSADGRFVIVYNGEIYNYRELKRDLEERGCRFTTDGDTEVLLELLALDGIAAIGRVRGMFGFALWDKKTRSLCLGRDPYGIKPLYFTDTPSGVLFASQVKALTTSGLVSRAIDPAGLVGFFLWGSVPEPWTIYGDIKSVPAGAIVTVRDGRVAQIVRYADVSRLWDQAGREGSAQDLRDNVREAVRDTIRAHLVSDVPVSVLLSGGIDSGTVAGVMAELGQSVEGVTVGFSEFAGTADDEVPASTCVADHFGIRQTVRIVEQQEFAADLPKILDAMDQPSIDGINTWFAAKAVAERGYKVVLSGIGGDELLCGYSSFRSIPRLALAGRMLGLSAKIGLPADSVFGLAGRALGMPKLGAIPSIAATAEGAYFLQRALFLPSEISRIVGNELAEEGLRHLRDPSHLGAEPPAEIGHAGWGGYVAAMESTRYLRNQLLRDADWASMAHSLELRTPLVDYALAKSLAPSVDRFRNGEGKRYLSMTAHRGMPSEIVNRRKTGFGLPIGKWLDRSADGRAWERIPMLRHPATHWARRWAYSVAEAFGAGAARPRVSSA